MEPPTIEIDIQVAPQYADRVDVGRLQEMVAKVLSMEGVEGPVTMTLVVMGDEAIQELNVRHRGVDRPTDVLAFPLAGASTPFIMPPDSVPHLGDVAISFPRAEEQAKRYGHSLERELLLLAAHGTLHLLGYDDEVPSGRRRMRSKERAVLAGYPPE